MIFLVHRVPGQFQPAVTVPQCGVQFAGLVQGDRQAVNAPARDLAGDGGHINISGLAHAGQVHLDVAAVTGGRALCVKGKHPRRAVVVLPRELERAGGGRGCLIQVSKVSPKLLGGGTPFAALTWTFASSKVMSSGYMA